MSVTLPQKLKFTVVSCLHVVASCANTKSVTFWFFSKFKILTAVNFQNIVVRHLVETKTQFERSKSSMRLWWRANASRQPEVTQWQFDIFNTFKFLHLMINGWIDTDDRFAQSLTITSFRFVWHFSRVEIKMSSVSQEHLARFNEFNLPLFRLSNSRKSFRVDSLFLLERFIRFKFTRHSFTMNLHSVEQVLRLKRSLRLRWFDINGIKMSSRGMHSSIVT